MSLRELAEGIKNGDKRKKRLKGNTLTRLESRRIRRKGARVERQLVAKLRNMGFKAVRIPLSAPSSEPLPDVFATKGSSILAFEIKAPNAERVYFKKKQMTKLFEFLSFFSVFPQKKAVLVAKFPYKWVFKIVKKSEDQVIGPAC